MKLMINEEMVRNKLYDKFIKPTHTKKNFIGIEIEIPIINLDKKAVDFEIVHQITQKFQKHYSEFKTDGIDYDGNVFALILTMIILCVMIVHIIISNLQWVVKKIYLQ